MKLTAALLYALTPAFLVSSLRQLCARSNLDIARGMIPERWVYSHPLFLVELARQLRGLTPASPGITPFKFDGHEFELVVEPDLCMKKGKCPQDEFITTVRRASHAAIPDGITEGFTDPLTEG